MEDLTDIKLIDQVYFCGVPRKRKVFSEQALLMDIFAPRDCISVESAAKLARTALLVEQPFSSKRAIDDIVAEPSKRTKVESSAKILKLLTWNCWFDEFNLGNSINSIHAEVV